MTFVIEWLCRIVESSSSKFLTGDGQGSFVCIIWQCLYTARLAVNGCDLIALVPEVRMGRVVNIY